MLKKVAIGLMILVAVGAAVQAQVCVEPTRVADQDGGEIVTVKGPLTPSYDIVFRSFPGSQEISFTLAPPSGGLWRSPGCTPWLVLENGRQETLGAMKQQGGSLTGTFTRTSISEGVKGIWLCGETTDLGEPLRCGLRKAFPGVSQNSPIARKEQAPVPAVDPCQGYSVQREVDRFTGAVSAKAFQTPRIREYGPMVLWSSEQPDLISFEVIGSSESWRYLSCHPLSILVDGHQVTGSPAVHHGEVGRGYVIETVSSVIPWDQAEPFLKASEIEYKVCNDERRASPGIVCETQGVMRIAAQWRAEHRPADKPASAVANLCPPKVRERLKARGLSDQAIAEICAE
jgi:hypothetical protein